MGKLTLEPCPFCGAPAEFAPALYDYKFDHYRVICGSKEEITKSLIIHSPCCATSPCFRTKTEAAKFWNRRTGAEAVSE